ncbi:MAG: signal peptidase II [Clostridia bacterium]|nr:signal peptidase II [Clostridia bacterium]MBQ2136253.1 signal peptidase II [Clostridia bacterium]MBQ2237594.1 signal peptidase II [Clostridia bacterium]
MISFLLPILCGVIFLIADQISKAYFLANFTLGQSAEFIPGIIDFVYIHNTGSAWGMFSGKTIFLIVISLIVMAVCIGILIKLKNNNMLMTWSIILVLSGGIGNLIDRVFRGGKVVDFLHFEFYPEFPVFNIADCAVVIGGGLLILAYVLDIVKESKNKNAKN